MVLVLDPTQVWSPGMIRTSTTVILLNLSQNNGKLTRLCYIFYIQPILERN